MKHLPKMVNSVWLIFNPSFTVCQRGYLLAFFCSQQQEREKKKRDEKRRNMVMHQPNGESRPVSARRPKDDSTQPLMSSPSHSKSIDDGQFGKFSMFVHVSCFPNELLFG